ncbi:MAG: hypothetical protein E6G41_02985 [Actinobacteria bacterium]|nr:MAG: hypothetical protein E6G41_02985 [Actinomycetota bacterium]
MRTFRRVTGLLVLAIAFGAVPGAAVAAKPAAKHGRGAATAAGFSFGQPQATTVGAKGCGTNPDGEPAIHVSRANDVFLGSERGVGSGSDAWRALGGLGGPGASACGQAEYRGQPNGFGGVGASGGDIDVAIAPARNPAGVFNVYVASLNLASINVATSQDRGTTFSQVPVVEGVPVDDREWIAAYGSSTALLSYHDIVTNNIDVLRSDDGGTTYVQTARAIPDSDYKAQNNELGNLVIDHRNAPAGAAPGDFFAYQSFVAPHDANDSNYDEAFVAVSTDGGRTFTDRPVPCSLTRGKDLDHNFPNVSVAPDGSLWYAWSDDRNVRTAVSHDHGQTWSCSGNVATGLKRGIFPWLAATSAGVDLVFYGTPDANGPNMTWYAEFAQNTAGTTGGWGAPQAITSVHKGDVCEGGISCTGGRQLLDDFGVDTDGSGWAHIAYSHDSPDLNGPGTYTGYAVQTGGTRVGVPN